MRDSGPRGDRRSGACRIGRMRIHGFRRLSAALLSASIQRRLLGGTVLSDIPRGKLSRD
jgi:hypothetical protein